MATSLYQLLSNNKVEIPLIQRDYAQGRKTGNAPHVRERFLNALFGALLPGGEILELDFVYGYKKKIELEDMSGDIQVQNLFIPLDGQQRLTTLFLIHWYVAYREGKLEQASVFLKKFTYETRHSSRVFCQKLIAEDIILPKAIENKDDKSIDAHIRNQAWFFSGWVNDPTVDSMLTMLGAIEKKYNDEGLDDVWDRLVSSDAPIVFHQLDMGALNLPDELYIKMNSRGKPLTDFEYFKSQFSEVVPQNLKEDFTRKIDKEWSDLFWEQLKDTTEGGKQIKDIAKYVDESFLRFFRFVTDILVAKHEIDVSEFLKQDEITYFKKVYEKGAFTKELFTILDALEKENLAKLFDDHLYISYEDFEVNKTRLFFTNPSVNLFEKCCKNYDQHQSRNPFSIGEQLMLYAFIYSLVNNVEDVPKGLRIVRNLVANSDDTLRRDNMSALLSDVELVMRGDQLPKASKFNNNQIDDENRKAVFLQNNVILREQLYRLEDHHLLQGCTATFDLDASFVQCSEEFIKLFAAKDCDYRSIKRALFSIGDYSQFYGSEKSLKDKIRWGVWMHYQLGSNNHAQWRELFTPSNARVGFTNTKMILSSLLDLLNEKTIEQVIEDYLSSEETPKDWRYYYIKYHECRRMPRGYSSWQMNKVAQYSSRMMNSSQLNGNNWSPYLNAIHKRSNIETQLGNFNDPLVVEGQDVVFKIKNWNRAFNVNVEGEKASVYFENLASHPDFKIKETDKIEYLTYPINQEEGLDVEDRIVKGIRLGDFLSTYKI